jgi:hypothetical protein
MRRLTIPETTAALGDPTRFIRTDGTVGAGWERQIIAYVQLPAPLPLSWEPSIKVTRLKCHKRLVPIFKDALRDLFLDAQVWRSIGDTGGVYEFRAKRTNRKAISMHAFAAAIDIDVRDNEQGTAGRMHPRAVEIMERHSLLWGGRFKGKSIDPQHFEISDETLARIT